MVEPAGVDGDEALAPFELYALHYAVHSGRRESDNFLHADPQEAGSDLHYFVWLDHASLDGSAARLNEAPVLSWQELSR